MAPRAYWKGFLKLSLVSCPIALFPATSEREKISFHQLNKDTGNRVRYRKVDAETGDEVEQANIIKGYEVAKGDYVELDPEELEAVAIESKRTIEIDEFVPKKEIDELYMRDPYYIVPDGAVGQQAFAVIREVIRNEGMVAIGKVVFTSREHIIMLEARDNGMMGAHAALPLRSPLRRLFRRHRRREGAEGHARSCRPHRRNQKRQIGSQKFEDQYEDALKEVIGKKQKGERSSDPRSRSANVVNLMDAPRQSVKAENGGERRKPTSRSHPREAKKAARSNARNRKAGVDPAQE